MCINTHLDMSAHATLSCPPALPMTNVAERTECGTKGFLFWRQPCRKYEFCRRPTRRFGLILPWKMFRAVTYKEDLPPPSLCHTNIELRELCTGGGCRMRNEGKGQGIKEESEGWLKEGWRKPFLATIMDDIYRYCTRKVRKDSRCCTETLNIRNQFKVKQYHNDSNN